MNVSNFTAPVCIVRRPVPEDAVRVHPNPTLQRVLSARRITCKRELQCSLQDLPRPDSFPGLSQVVDRLLIARQRRERIVVVGDYDCDGATSTCVALEGLKMLGFDDLRFIIPGRIKYGYGLSPAIVDLAFSQYQPEVILTVDNGVASVDGVACAAGLGVDVVVTDHHLPPDSLPAAVAIANPNLSKDGQVFQNLAGVGVIFYVLIALRGRLAQAGDSFAGAPLATLLDLVAVGTVADLVPLDSVNRILVEQGLRRMRCGEARVGLRALAEVAGISLRDIETQHIGFGIGPRLNAAGRLDDMTVGVHCLLSSCAKQAGRLADQLNRLNAQRRSIQADMQADADTQLAALPDDLFNQQTRFSLCLQDERWHEGVIGILAGRLKQRLHIPVIICTRADEQRLKGSARSVPGVHIRDAIQRVAVQCPGMIENFGGHAMAAGLTLRTDRFSDFQDMFDEVVRDILDGQRQDRVFLTDGSLSDAERTLDNARLLARLMPWGQEFEAPLFDDQFKVLQVSTLKNQHLKLSLCGASGSAAEPVQAIAFNVSEKVEVGDVITSVYSLNVNRWQGSETLQLQLHHLDVLDMRYTSPA